MVPTQNEGKQVRPMSISGAASSAVSALAVHSKRVGAIAQNVANVGTKGYKAVDLRTATLVTKEGVEGSLYTPGGVVGKLVESSSAGVDLGGEFSRLVQARSAYQASITTLQTSLEMSMGLADIKA
jgi:flagellar hook protein FlgE